MKNSVSIGRFRICQTEDAVTGASDIYDLVLAGVSWESRATKALEIAKLRHGKTVLIRFASSDPAIVARKDATEAELRKMRPDAELLQLESSLSFQKNSALLERRLIETVMEVGRPLRVFIDISCIPRSYCAFLVGLGFGRELVGRLDCGYSEGFYTWEAASADVASGPRSIISLGEWSSLQIPYLEAQETIPAERDLLVQIGGEIGYSLPFVERYEPVRLGLMFIENGVERVLVNKNEESAYNTLIAEPKVARSDYAIEDVVGVTRHIHDFCALEPDRVVTGLAIGSKAHSLGMALAAVDIENLEVVCRIPTSYGSGDVAATGRVFYYSIEDRFEPTAYFGPAD